MNVNEELIKTKEEEALAETADLPTEVSQAPQEPAAETPDPYVGIQEDYEEPYLEPIEEGMKYVPQKGDFWAFLIAALGVFLPILLLFFGGIMLVVWFFSR